MNHAEESTKISKDVHFTVLGRAIADATRAGRPIAKMVADVAAMRLSEQTSSLRSARFAALARQVGDAASVGRDTAALIDALVELREAEAGPAA